MKSVLLRKHAVRIYNPSLRPEQETGKVKVSLGNIGRASCPQKIKTRASEMVQQTTVLAANLMMWV